MFIDICMAINIAGSSATAAKNDKVQRILPARTKIIELSVLKREDSKQIWRNMNIFSAFVTKENVQQRREQELKEQCEASAGQVPYVAAPAAEKPGDVDKRQNEMHKALQQLKPSSKREKARAAKTRLKLEEVEQRTAEELGSDAVNQFLDKTLCNLPLSVRLCGQLLYASKGLSEDSRQLTGWGNGEPFCEIREEGCIMSRVGSVCSIW